MIDNEQRKLWSQSVQRDLPRPTSVNTNILKGAPHRDQKYRDLYEVRCVNILRYTCTCISENDIHVHVQLHLYINMYMYKFMLMYKFR